MGRVSLVLGLMQPLLKQMMLAAIVSYDQRQTQRRQMIRLRLVEQQAAM